MKINAAQVTAFSRHALSFSMGAIAVASATQVVSPSDAEHLSGAINQLANGSSTLFSASAALVSALTGIYAAYTASDKSQISAVAANPAVTSVVVTTPALALSVPSAKVIPQQ